MKNWMEGYNADLTYTMGHFKELNPEYLNMCAVLKGVHPIPIEESFVYCELGCGYGLSSLINAANYPQGTFYALDYSPSQIAYAQKLAKESGLTNIYFLENSFQDVIDNPTLLPQCDFIIFHGIYAWISDENRKNLVDICANHLKSGGMVYNSYNAKPGWSTIETIQKLMMGLSKEKTGLDINKVDFLVDSLKKILTTESSFARKHIEELEKQIKSIEGKNKTYIVHEYLHSEWRAFFFPEVAQEMERAKLNYLGLALLSESISEQLYSPSLKSSLKNVTNINNRELIKDIYFNIRFRKDIYSRGNYGKMSQEEKYLWFFKKQWIRTSINKKIEKMEFSFISGKVGVEREPFDLILDALNKKNMNTIELQKITKLSIGKLIDSLVLLYNDGYIAPYNRVKKQAQKLNIVIINQMLGDIDINTICYPNASIGFPIGMLSKFWLKAISEGMSTSKELVEYTYNYFVQTSKSLNIKGELLKGEALKKHLKESEKEWREKILPVWINMGVIDIKNSK